MLFENVQGRVVQYCGVVSALFNTRESQITADTQVYMNLKPGQNAPPVPQI